VTVRRKLVLVCAGVAALQLASAAAVTGFSRRAASHQAGIRHAHEQLEHLSRIEASLVRQHKALGDLALAPPGFRRARQLLELRQAQSRTEAAAARLDELTSIENEGRAEELAARDYLVAQSRLLRQEVDHLSEAGDPDASSADGHQALEERLQQLITFLGRLMTEENQEVLLEDAKASRAVARAETMAWLTPLVSALLLVGALSLVVRSISTRLSHLLTGATRVAGGDLEQPVPVEAADEFGNLASAFNEMQLSLKERIAERDVALRDARFRDLSEAAPIAIAELDASGHPVYVNRRWAALTAGAAPDRPWSELVQEADRERAMRLFDEAAGAAEELRLAIGDQPIWVAAQVAPLADGEGRKILALADITSQKEALVRAEDMSRELMAVSRKAGMAEVSAGVLHNVGNVLNSVVVSAGTLHAQLQAARVANLVKAADLLEQNRNDLATFLSTERGKLVPAYLCKAASQLSHDLVSAQEDITRVQKGIEHIRAVVATQQSYAKTAPRTESVRLSEIVEDVLRMNAASFERHDVRIAKRFEVDPQLVTDRHKIMQILINLISNARYALGDGAGGADERTILIATQESQSGRIALSVTDNGVGISPENLARIFEHGFTTRKTGHGFGLHSSALAAHDLGGQLRVASDGAGRGATFILELPPPAEERAA
jgi:PAS domain S-box-containing protein